MKFCYLDESGTGGQPIAVMAGVIADVNRMHLTKDAWSDLLAALSEIVGATVQEFHSHKFYSGSGIWKGLDGEHRARIISAIIQWMKKRKHKMVYSSVDVQRYQKQSEAEARLEGLTVWRTMALHAALSLQRCHQAETKNKGHTVLEFDGQVKEKDKFTNLVVEPPSWTDNYYNKGIKQKRLDQLIDVPHFVDSKKVELVQVADLYSFILRRHLELQSGHDEPKYEGEGKKVSRWAKEFLQQTISNGHIFPKQKPSHAVQLFQSVAPNCCL